MKLAETRQASSAPLPEEWAHDVPRRTAAGVPEEVGACDQAPPGVGAVGEAGRLGSVPVLVADAGYGRGVYFRLALEERSCSYVMAVEPKETDRPAEPSRTCRPTRAWARLRCPATASRPVPCLSWSWRVPASRRSPGARAAKGR
ncbi:transposase [Streptomyces sp. NPDC001401]|uniref:transposase n=1 Tax=Streptomyces sp. NPDC001401 TaxID=3364570 RepID=UPI00367A44E1